MKVLHHWMRRVVPDPDPGWTYFQCQITGAWKREMPCADSDQVWRSRSKDGKNWPEPRKER
jgi:hypothetical protein